MENNSIHKGEFTIDLIKQVFADIFYKSDEVKKETRIPSITKCEWEEDGQTYYTWKIDTGRQIAYTGDEGMKIFSDAMGKDLKENK